MLGNLHGRRHTKGINLKHSLTHPLTGSHGLLLGQTWHENPPPPPSLFLLLWTTLKLIESKCRADGSLLALRWTFEPADPPLPEIHILAFAALWICCPW